MGIATAGATATSTNAANSANLPSRRSLDEKQRPRNPGHFSPTLQTNGSRNRENLTPQDALAQLSPSEPDAVPPNTESIEEFNALLASLESDDEKEMTIEDVIPTLGEPRAVPSVLLETSPNRGLDDAEVLSRRKRFGWNMMKEESRSHFRKFLMFFVGPIQCVMIVSWGPFAQAGLPSRLVTLETEWCPADTTFVVGVCTGCGPTRLDRHGSHCRLAVAQRGRRFHSRLPSW